MKRKANAKAIHICNSHKPTHEPKIAKEYVLPALTEEKVRPHNNVYKSLGSKWLN
jgi:hypothetical protein